MLGSVEPRLWTPPLRELTPETSYGFDVNRFARNTLQRPLYPWQEWLNIHAGELLPDGRPRFRIVLVLVARQNGKTEVLVVLTLYWQFVEAVPLILGTSTKLDYAKESWVKARKLVEAVRKRDDAEAEAFKALIPPGRWYKEGNNDQVSWTTEDSRYKIAAANEEGGRSLTIHRLVCDEFRQQHDYNAWGAAEPAASPDDAQIWCPTNAGDHRSVVLNDNRADALEFIKWWGEYGSEDVAQLLLAGETVPGMPDFRIGLFEWSAPLGADPTDPRNLAMANPNFNRGMNGQDLMAKARKAVAKGGDALTLFLTEYLCIRVPHMNPALDLGAFRDCLDVGTLDAVRDRVALVVDVAPDGLRTTLAAAAVLPDGRVRGELVRSWEGPGCADVAGRELPGLVGGMRVKPRAFGWLPGGPGAALGASLGKRKGRSSWPPPGVVVEEIRGDVPGVCMAFDQLVTARRFVHSGDPLLTDQAEGAERLPVGDRWVFSRRGDGHVEGLYAQAGAAYLAQMLPPPLSTKPGLITLPDDDED